jgi:glycosyltransferase involved in cell wall biosynthesis
LFVFRVGAEWLVPPRDPHALAEAILDALSNPEEACRRAENAYKHLLDNFTVEKQVDKWEQALQAAVENFFSTINNRRQQ